MASVRGEKDGQPGFAHQINGEWRFIADDPANAPGADVFFPGTNQKIAGGAPGAAIIGFGEQITNAATRGEAAVDTISQLGEESPEQTAAQIEFKEIQRLLAPLEEAHPFATAVGQSVPGFLLPSAKAAQTIGGVAEGMLADPENPILGGALGGVGGFLGGLLGQKLASAVAARSSGAAGRLAAKGVPTTLAQRTGSATEKSIEGGLQAIPVIGAWAAAPLRAQQRALNRGAQSVFGYEGALTRKGLGEVKAGISKQFQKVQSAIPDQVLDPNLIKKLNAAGVVDDATNDFIKASGIADGEALMAIRSNLNSDMADAFLNANRKEGRQLQSMLGELDNVIEAGLPDQLVGQWATARKQWQFLTAITKGKAINGQGDVALASMTSALDKIYPNFRVGADLPGAAKGFGELVQALDELPKALQSSGTAERAAAASLLSGSSAIVASPLAVLPALRAAGQAGVDVGATAGIAGANAVLPAVSQALEGFVPEEENNAAP